MRADSQQPEARPWEGEGGWGGEGVACNAEHFCGPITKVVPPHRRVVDVVGVK